MFLQAIAGGAGACSRRMPAGAPPADAAAARGRGRRALKTKEVNKPEVYAALAALTATSASR